MYLLAYVEFMCLVLSSVKFDHVQPTIHSFRVTSNQLDKFLKKNIEQQSLNSENYFVS